MSMNITKVPLLDTGYFSGLTKAYLANDSALQPFYKQYFKLENFALAIEERKHIEINRTHLFEVLDQQHSPFYKEFPGLARAVASLKEPNTFTITTGHQICLATGPLYFIYKIASAINLSRKLKVKYPAYNFVPVYWMATEDHDFEEINHLHLFNKKITWNIDAQGATGRISTKEINSFLDEISTILGDKVNECLYFEEVLNAYSKHPDLAEATRSLVLHLFGDKGLLVIDADHKTLKNDFKPIIKKDIPERISYTEVSNSMQQLIAQNLIKEEKIQVKPRAINFFYLKDNMRKRISFEDNEYKILDTSITFTEAQLLQEIDEFPERFSPNVIMRPLYQEFILPNLAYIGGAGELAYWFELKGTFDAHSVSFPILALRNSFMWIDQKQVDKLKQFEIEIIDIFKPIEQLLQQVLKTIGFNEPSLSSEKEIANQLFDLMKESISAIDQTLVNSADAERQKLFKAIEILEQKLIKAQKLKHETSLNQIKKIKEQLFPEGGLQERFDNILWLNLKYGNEVIHQIIELAQVEMMEFTIIIA